MAAEATKNNNTFMVLPIAVPGCSDSRWRERDAPVAEGVFAAGGYTDVIGGLIVVGYEESSIPVSTPRGMWGAVTRTQLL